MPTRDVLHIDGFDGRARTASGVVAFEGGTLRDVLDQLGARWHVEREEYEPQERELAEEARQFLGSYVYEDPGSVLAIYWRDAELLATGNCLFRSRSQARIDARKGKRPSRQAVR